MNKMDNKYIEALVERRALVREALDGDASGDFQTYILRKENLLVIVSNCDYGRCYECMEKIRDDGLRVKITEFGIIELFGFYFERTSTLFFHRYHFGIND